MERPYQSFERLFWGPENGRFLKFLKILNFHVFSGYLADLKLMVVKKIRKVEKKIFTFWDQENKKAPLPFSKGYLIGHFLDLKKYKNSSTEACLNQRK